MPYFGVPAKPNGSRGFQTSIAVLLVLNIATLSAHAAQSRDSGPAPPVQPRCSCPDPYADQTPTGVIWQDQGPPPDLPTLARLLAPVLWFSSDEPLLVLRARSASIPMPHPCDEPSHGAIVYYQATRIVLRGDEQVVGTGEDDPRFFEKVDHFVLKYFFYYDEDHGLRPHRHDLEAVELLVHLEHTREGCYRVRIERVEGHAHGLRWYSNILRVQRDTVFPLVVLVEEGKHASVPDRNGDGVYTPGYDVNTRVNDAWGLRDVLGSSILLGARYTASMSKPRDPSFRLFPPEDVAVCGSERRRSNGGFGDHLGRYTVRAATDVPQCTIADTDADFLHSAMRYHRFGAAWPAAQYESDFASELLDPENAFRWISAVNARLESNVVGVTVQGPGLDLREFWVVPRAHVRRGWALDALITPSASRWADWYVAAGVERLRANAAGADTVTVSHTFASEIGVKLRAAVRGRSRWALLGYQFGGVRLGVRASGFSHLRQPRLIVEVGAGAF
jgi:hypothetical protein